MSTMLIINSIPNPYRTFMFNKLYEHGRARGIDIRVAFQAAGEKGRPWKPEHFQPEYPYYISTGWGLTSKRKELYDYWTFNRDIVRDIRKGQIRWLFIAPFMSYGSWWMTFAAPPSVTPLFWCETNLIGARRKTGIAVWIKRKLIDRCPILLCPGQRAVDYVHEMQPASVNKPVIWLPNIVDTSVFRKRSAELRADRARVRAELNIPPDEVLILGVGRCIAIKGYDKLVDAAAHVPGKYRIFVCGDGELLEPWRERARQKGVADRVLFPGAFGELEIARWLAAADWFVHASHEDASPLATIEAVTAGLPMAVSTATGNAPEVVDEGRNGFVFNSSDPAETIAAVRRMVETDPVTRAQLARRSDELSVERFDPDQVSERFFDQLIQFAPP